MDKLWNYEKHGEIIGCICNADNEPCQYEDSDTCPFNFRCAKIEESHIEYTDKGYYVEWTNNGYMIRTLQPIGE